MKSSEILKNGVTVAQVYEEFISQCKTYPNPMEEAQTIASLLPNFTEKTVALADEAKAGIWTLPGCSEKRFIGNPPLWHDNPFQNNEYVFQISRMLHWLPMLNAYHITKDESYAEKILSEMLDWIRNCPRPPIYSETGELEVGTYNSPLAKEWRVLECGIRPYKVWLPVLEGLVCSKAFTVEVFDEILYSLYEHCEVVAVISPAAWPLADHNHFLMENLGLLSVACSFPQLKMAEEWKLQGIRDFERSIRAQVLESGAQIEGCPSYHGGCIFWFATAIVYSRKYGFDLSNKYLTTFDKMARQSVYYTRPNGTNFPWGDTSTAPGSLTAAAMYSYMGNHDPQWLSAARHFYSYESILNESIKHVWKMEDKEAFCKQILALQDSAQEPALPASMWDKELSHVYMRTNWSRDALCLMFACRTPVQNNHAHIDPCAFDFSAYGKPLVVDPGKYTYKNCEARQNLKSAKWHNTLTVNGNDPWEYIASWEYGKQEKGDIMSVDFADEFIWSVAKHYNYQPTLHTRAVAIAQSEFAIVIDLVENVDSGDFIDLNYHLDNTCVTRKGNAIFTADSNEANIYITSKRNRVEAPPVLADSNENAVVIKTHHNEIYLSDGMVSDKNDSFRRSTVAQFHYENTANCKDMAFATLLYPTRANESMPVVEITEVALSDKAVTVTCDIDGKVLQFVMKDEKMTMSYNKE